MMDGGVHFMMYGGRWMACYVWRMLMMVVEDAMDDDDGW